MSYETERDADKPWGYWLRGVSAGAVLSTLVDEDGTCWASVRQTQTAANFLSSIKIPTWPPRIRFGAWLLRVLTKLSRNLSRIATLMATIRFGTRFATGKCDIFILQY